MQTMLVPMVDAPEQATAVVWAARYPQNDGKGGIRGIGGARASQWGRNARYVHEGNAQTCVLVKIETQSGIDNLLAITQTEGVDAVFIGPADLSASLGHVGNPAHSDVQATIGAALRRIVSAGKATGILTIDGGLALGHLELGATFAAVGVDTSRLVKATSSLASRFKTSGYTHRNVQIFEASAHSRYAEIGAI